MPARTTVALGSCLSLVFCAASAAADGTSKVSETKGSSGWSYSFDDDPLESGGRDLSAPRIQVLAHALRQTLIRPRTAFVLEMFKSVEAL
jgi:hypothetical protein